MRYWLSMANNNETEIAKRKPRSPAYPMFSLGEAIIRVRKLWESQRKHPAHPDAVLANLGYSGKSGTALRTVAALGHYGLTVETGSAETRRITISERSQDIMFLEESDPRRIQALRDAALNPTIFGELWQRYGKTLPNDEAIRPFLLRDKGYNEDSAQDVIQSYRESFELAKLGDLSENVHSRDENPLPPSQNNP